MFEYFKIIAANKIDFDQIFWLLQSKRFFPEPTSTPPLPAQPSASFDYRELMRLESVDYNTKSFIVRTRQKYSLVNFSINVVPTADWTARYRLSTAPTIQSVSTDYNPTQFKTTVSPFINFVYTNLVTAPEILAPEILGNIINDSFNPQIGSYSENGTANYIVTPGNMAISGGSAALTNYIQLDDYQYNVENIKFSMTYRMTNTTSGQVGPLIVRKSLNAASLFYQVYFGIYFCPNNDKAILQVFGSSVNSLHVGTEFDLTITDDATIEGEYLESSFVVRAKVNGILRDSYTINYNIHDNPLPGEGKPNRGIYRIIEPYSTINISNITISSQAYKYADLMTVGDSNGAGYFVTNQNTRFQQLLRDEDGITVTICSGSGDNSADILACANSIKLFMPKKIFLAIGTNDYAVNPVTWQTNYAALVSNFENAGIEVVVASLLPRDSNDYSGARTWINANYTGTNTIVDLFTPFLDPNPGNPTGINPLYSADGLHLNDAGAILYKSLLVTALN